MWQKVPYNPSIHDEDDFYFWFHEDDCPIKLNECILVVADGYAPWVTTAHDEFSECSWKWGWGITIKWFMKIPPIPEGSKDG